jgi:two-component system, OmpR family, sensor kinase
MSHSLTSRVRTLPSRLLYVPLRLKVMAGVGVVTLAALAAFDAGVVATMRHYLLTQTGNNLHLAMAETEPRLSSLVSAAAPAPLLPQMPVPPPTPLPSPDTPAPPTPLHPPTSSRGGLRYSRPAEPKQVPFRLGEFSKPGPGLLGDFEIAFVPRRGPVVILEAGATTDGGRSFIVMQSDVARHFAQPGLYTAPIDGGLFRILSDHVAAGSLIVGTSLDQVTETTDQVEAIVTYGSIAVVLLIGLGVFTVVGHGVGPVEAMARQADRITGGDLTSRVAAHNPRSEVGRLAAALNDMLARIEASQQQMRHFFGDASHELRTPLASLRANAQLYQQGALQDPGQVDEVMDRIVLETRRMGRLIDDMLGLARLGQQPRRFLAPVDLTVLVTGCAQRARIADPERAWQARIAEGLTVTGDQELLRHAVDNLLMNALVHTPADAACAISASASGGHVTIEVSDDGPGVPPDQLPHIFERFYRAGTRSGGSGSGLGLAIAAETVSAHGGTTQAAPVSPHGLRITLTLPARSEARSAPGLVASAS